VKCPLPSVVQQDVFARHRGREVRRLPSGFVETVAVFGTGDRFRIEVDIVADEDVEPAVAVIVREGAAVFSVQPAGVSAWSWATPVFSETR